MIGCLVVLHESASLFALFCHQRSGQQTLDNATQAIMLPYFFPMCIRVYVCFSIVKYIVNNLIIHWE